MTDVDHVAVRELPGLDGRAIDGGAVGGAEVVQHRGLSVEVDVDVPAGNRRVGQPERCVLPTADDVRTALQLVAATGSIIDGQGGGDLLRSRRRQSIVLAVILRVLLALLVTLLTRGRVALLVALVPVRLRLSLLVGLLRIARRRALLRRRLAPLLLPLLTLLVPDPLPVAGCVVGLRWVTGVRSLVALSRIALSLVRRPVLSRVSGWWAVLLTLVARTLVVLRILVPARLPGIAAVL